MFDTISHFLIVQVLLKSENVIAEFFEGEGREQEFCVA